MKMILVRVVLAVAMLLLATVATAPVASAQTADSAVTVSGTDQFKDLKVTVSQTKNLINQTVGISWTGGVQTVGGVTNPTNFLQIMQCWGGDSGPDRRQCQFGATGQTAGIASRQITSGLPVDPLEKDPLELNTRINNVPFWPAGQPAPPALIELRIDPFLDAQTTNEIPVARTRPGPGGTGEEFFEVQTQRQSAGFDCGAPVTVGATVTGKSCWLVIVPRGGTEVDGTTTNTLVSSPLSQTNWNRRIQISLEFLPATQSCPIGAAERPVLGHEPAVDAVGRWQRALCAGGGTVFSYTQITDDVARRRLMESSSPGLVVMNNPVPPDQVLPDRPLVYAPVALSGLAIAFNVERQNFLGVTGQDGERFKEMNLTPRLVAKLLTQSYRGSVAGSRFDTNYLGGNPESLTRDPEFLKYNPDYRDRDLKTKSTQPIVQLGTADNTALLWSWVYGDAEARAFLAGTKDESGMAVNVNPANKGLDTPPSTYPRNDQSCYKTTLLGSRDNVPVQVCTSDLYPFVNDTHEAGRAAGRGINLTRAPETVDPFGVVKYSKPSPETPGSRSVLAVVDTATAERYGMATAKLRLASPELGAERPFVAPTTVSMLAGLAAMKPSGVPGVLTPDPLTTNSAAYPLTALSHAVTAPALLDKAAGKDYGTFLRYAADKGQELGIGPGQLPFGYVPLPESLRAQTRAAAATIEAQAGIRVSNTTPDETTSGITASPRITTPGTTTPGTVGGPTSAGSGNGTTPTPTATGVTPIPGAGPAAGAAENRAGQPRAAVRPTPALPAPAVGALLVALLVCGGAAAALAPAAHYAGVTRRTETDEGGDATGRTAPRSRLSRLTVRPALFARRR